MTDDYYHPAFGRREIGRVSSFFAFPSPQNEIEAKGFEAFRSTLEPEELRQLSEAIETAITNYDYGRDTGYIIKPPRGYSTKEVSKRNPVPWAAEPHEGMIKSFQRLCTLDDDQRDKWDEELWTSIDDWKETQAEKPSDDSEFGTNTTNDIARRRRSRTGIRARRRRILKSLWERLDTVRRDEVVLNRKEERLKKDQRTLSRKAKRLSRKATKLSQWESELKQREREMQKKEASWSRRWQQSGLEKKSRVG
jgi:hypothetical protein